MILKDLTVGEVFTLEGAFYETLLVSPSGRIVLCYLLAPSHNFAGRPTGVADNFVDTTLERIPDPEDLTGDVFLTTAFSDLRFNREHETAEDRELANLL